MSKHTPGPRRITLERFAIEQGVTRLDHTVLSPSGKVSRRSRDSEAQKASANLDRFICAQADYQRAIDAGEIVDPEGRYRPTVKPSEAEVLRERAARDREIAKLAGARQARKLLARADALDAQAATLEAVREEPYKGHP